MSNTHISCLLLIGAVQRRYRESPQLGDESGDTRLPLVQTDTRHCGGAANHCCCFFLSAEFLAR